VSGVRRVLGGHRRRPEVDSAPAVGLAWLLRLRWVLGVGQMVVVLVAWAGFEAKLPVGELLGLAWLGLASNATLSWWIRGRPLDHWGTLVTVLILDAALLTMMLHRSGGAANPFSVFYLVHVVLAALLLDTRWTLVLAAVTSLGFGSLFLGLDPHAHHHGDFSAHLQGMWISYALAASLLGAFVVRVARALEERERQIAQLQRYQERVERLASLGALAAGAAHELGTPLGTILLLSRELERADPASLSPGQLREDARLLCAEAERCRGILDKMAARSEGGAGEAPARFQAGEILDELRRSLDPERCARLELSGDLGAPVHAPRQVLFQILLNLTLNALDAVASAGSSKRVRVEVSRQDGELCFCVQDDGPGLGEDALERLGDPFFTTKAPGQGMGLGLFLSSAFAERIGGRIEVESDPGSGARFLVFLGGAR
jgi:two-component system sensor histidine kinase RegB